MEGNLTPLYPDEMPTADAFAPTDSVVGYKEGEFVKFPQSQLVPEIKGGEWWIGGKNTGLPARGAEGLPGPVGPAYTLPAAGAALGGVKAQPKTVLETAEVKIGADGKLYSQTVGGGSSGSVAVRGVIDGYGDYEQVIRSAAWGVYKVPLSENRILDTFVIDGHGYAYIVDDSPWVLFFCSQVKWEGTLSGDTRFSGVALARFRDVDYYDYIEFDVKSMAGFGTQRKGYSKYDTESGVVNGGSGGVMWRTFFDATFYQDNSPEFLFLDGNFDMTITRNGLDAYHPFTCKLSVPPYFITSEGSAIRANAIIYAGHFTPHLKTWALGSDGKMYSVAVGFNDAYGDLKHLALDISSAGVPTSVTSLRLSGVVRITNTIMGT